MKKLLLTAASAALFLSGHAAAQAPSAAQQAAVAMADQLFDRYDLNQDGVVTRDEAAQARAQMASAESPKQNRKAERMLDRVFGNAQSVTRADVEAAAIDRANARASAAGAANSPSVYSY
jgi:hypothetical protein